MTGLVLQSLESTAGRELFKLVEWQVAFGPRYPGSAAHERFLSELAKYIKQRVDKLYTQSFEIILKAKRVLCTNIIGVIKASKTTNQGPILIGTHFDTRIIADNEKQDDLKRKPIIGANDGGSGTAILLHILDYLAPIAFKRDIYLVLFDAEDVGDIDDNQFAMGARYFVNHPIPQPPQEVIILDMVGGKNMVLNIDLHTIMHPDSMILATQILNIGMKKGYAPFIREKPVKHKYIVCDHTPFLLRGIPAFVLIDIDYPEWHTHTDLPAAMEEESLFMVEDVLLNYLCLFGV
jgi:glutaminyl-peptide cyclotransferase